MVATYEYCPGNGTRYYCVLADVGGGMFLLSWLRNSDTGGTAFLFSKGSFIAPSYIMEKMNLHNEGDAVALLLLIYREIPGMQVLLPTGYNPETGCWDGVSHGAVLK
jgi:hypothetical protein